MPSSVEIVSVNISAEKGTVKKPVPEIRMDERGVETDAHAGAWHRQVSLLSQVSIARFSADAGRRISPGEFAENLTIGGMDLDGVAVLDRFRIGSAELEVTQIGKKCHGDTCAIFREIGRCVMPKEGIFCRVLQGGLVRPQDRVEYLPRPLKLHIMTLSDRAHRGEYDDLSGPRIRELLEEFFQGTRWHPEITSEILPDDAELLRAKLAAARDDGIDTVFTTGGTGVGPRDMTPETVAAFCEKAIPGIMEAIRAKFGARNSNALLSRGVAGVAGRTLVYTLPGSVRAVGEYMEEILKTWEHLVFMLHGLGHH